MDEFPFPTVVLVKNDNSRVNIDIRAVRLSGLLKFLIEEYKENEIRISEIEPMYIDLIAEFLNHYKDCDPVKVDEPLPIYDIAECYGLWDDIFISEVSNRHGKVHDDRHVLFEMMKSANFFDCKALLDLVCSKIACTIIKKDLSGKDILDFLGLEEDMTEEDIRIMQINLEDQSLKVKQPQG